MQPDEIWETLDGQEVRSIEFAQVVGVDAERRVLHLAHDERTVEPTDDQLRTLFDEAFEQEFGTSNVEHLLEQEFGR